MISVRQKPTLREFLWFPKQEEIFVVKPYIIMRFSVIYPYIFTQLLGSWLRMVTRVIVKRTRQLILSLDANTICLGFWNILISATLYFIPLLSEESCNIMTREQNHDCRVGLRFCIYWFYCITISVIRLFLEQL